MGGRLRAAVLGRRGASVALVTGVAALVAAAAVACRAQPAPDVGGAEVTALATAPTTAPAAPPPTEAKAAVVPPKKLRIPAIDVVASVNPVGVDAAGDFAVPPSVDQVGWYRFGPGVNASAGSVVIAGHVDSREQGRGAFFRLRELERGDEVTVTGDDGVVHTFRVIAREEYRKTKIPLDRYFARDGEPRLTLITCGGPFDPVARHYRDNIVITAVE
jgi:hypothetical protein